MYLLGYFRKRWVDATTSKDVPFTSCEIFGQKALRQGMEGSPSDKSGPVVFQAVPMNPGQQNSIKNTQNHQKDLIVCFMSKLK